MKDRVFSLLRSAGEGLLELLYPNRCCFCRRLLEPGPRICPRCRKELPYTRGAAAEQKFPHLSRCLSPLYYENQARDSLLRYKFSGMRCYAGTYAELMAGCLRENLPALPFDGILWVPLSRRRLRRRGYDQARLLAEALGESLSLPVLPALEKTRDNPAQSRTGGAEKRRANVKGVYRVPDPDSVREKRLLLVDDIVTTGATLSECAGTLRRAGAKSVDALTLARRRE